MVLCERARAGVRAPVRAGVSQQTSLTSHNPCEICTKLCAITQADWAMCNRQHSFTWTSTKHLSFCQQYSRLLQLSSSSASSSSFSYDSSSKSQHMQEAVSSWTHVAHTRSHAQLHDHKLCFHSEQYISNGMKITTCPTAAGHSAQLLLTGAHNKIWILLYTFNSTKHLYFPTSITFTLTHEWSAAKSSSQPLTVSRLHSAGGPLGSCCLSPVLSCPTGLLSNEVRLPDSVQTLSSAPRLLQVLPLSTPTATWKGLRNGATYMPHLLPWFCHHGHLLCQDMSWRLKTVDRKLHLIL